MATAVFNYTGSQVWCKDRISANKTTGSGNEQSIVIPISGLPTGAIINNATLTFTVGEIHYGSFGSLHVNGLKVTGVDVPSTHTVAVTVSGNESVSATFKFVGKRYSNANTENAVTVNLGFTNIYVTVDYTNPSSNFTLSTSSVDAGGTITANILATDSNYTHRMTVSFGSRSAAVDGTNTFASFKMPLEWLDHCTYQIPRGKAYHLQSPRAHRRLQDSSL